MVRAEGIMSDCHHDTDGQGQIPFADKSVHIVCLGCGADLHHCGRTVDAARLVELQTDATRWHPTLRAVIETYPKQ